LTRYGERLIQLYDLLAQIQQKAFDVLKDDGLPLDSLLAAISRFSLQTSARNQLFGTVIERDNEEVQQHINVLLTDGKTRIRAALTQQSADRLSLLPGKEILALIKAPWITLSYQATNADNALAGKVHSIQQGHDNCEVLIALNASETLCATIPTAQLEEMALVQGAEVFAQFDADKVIIATLC